MNYKYKLLQDNPKVCKRLFGIKFELLETILVKVQKSQRFIFKRKSNFHSMNRR